MFFEVVLLLLNKNMDIFVFSSHSYASLLSCWKKTPQLSEMCQLHKVKYFAVPILTFLTVLDKVKSKT